MSKDGVVCELPGTLYLMDGTVGDMPNRMLSVRFPLHTSAGFNIIQCSALPPNWEYLVEIGPVLQKLNEANGRPLELLESV